MKTKQWLMLILSLVLIMALSLPVFAEQEEIMLDDCDSSTWHGGGNAKDRNEKTEGVASVSWTVPAGGSFAVHRVWSTPVDAGEANRLEFDLYVSCADAYYTLTGGESLELTSSGVPDQEEIAWNLTSFEVVDGWNHIVLQLPRDGACDLSRINFMRLYANANNYGEAFVLKLDNIRLTYSDGADFPTDIPEDLIIGTQDSSTAVPPPADPIEVNKPYNPWGTPETSSDAAEKPSDNAKPDDNGNDQEAPVAGGCAGTGLGIAWLFGSFAVSLAVVLKRNTKLVALFCVLVMLLTACTPKVPEPDQGGTEGDDTEQGDEQDKEPIHPFFTVDQTGHPEVSADKVDVEALLTVDPNYSTKKDYKINYVSTSPIADFSKLPRVELHENAKDENGLSVVTTDGAQPEYLLMKEKDSWMMQYWDKTNRFYVTADAATREAYRGKDITLNFVVYLTQDLELLVDYINADGEECTVKTNCSRMKQWTTVTVTLPNVAMNGSLEGGNDFYIFCKGPDITRLNAVYLDVAVEGKAPQTGLIKSEFETNFNIIADANVLSFGATGNGLTDDTDAFKDAIAHLSKQGGTIFVPAGYYCLTETLTLPSNVALVGELEMGTANGTVLCIYGGKGSTKPSESAIMMNHQSSVQNIAFWYPEQTIVNGQAIPYPPTISQCGSEGVTVRNVTFVNSYFALNYATLFSQASNSLQYTRDIYGTCLNIGYYNTPSYDIGKLENFNFAPDYWLKSGLPGTPNAELLRTYMLRNSTGIILERIDWTYIADITVKGYRIGIQTSQDPQDLGTPNGHMYNINLLDCYYCLYADELSWMIASDCHFRAVGNDGATAVYMSPKCAGDLVITYGILESAGANAVLNYGSSKIILNDCAVKSASGTAFAAASGKKYSLVNTTVQGGDDYEYKLVTDNSVPALPEVDYGKTVITKPASDRLIKLTDAPYGVKHGDDITDELQAAIDELKETGGTVYLPAGSYTVSDHIDVWAGVELRGIAIWSHSFNPTQINTSFGLNDPDGEALFTLYDGAGMIGISVVYNTQNTNDLKPYSFTIQGNGKDIYLVDVTLPTSWNGVDFATYRCDNHYIEFLYGAFLNTGIQVGAGSENGIIRDCHFTPNCFAVHTDDNWWTGPYVSIMTRSRPFIIGESKNQILYHNFTYGAYQGLTVLDGAQDAYILSHGVDSGDISAYFSGDCTVTLVNTELVNLYTAGTAKHFNYVHTEEDFTGKVDFINVAGWGTCKNAFNLNGDGEVNVYGGNIVSAGEPMCRLNAGSASFVGVINASRTTDAVAGDMAMSLNLSGNLFASGIRIDKSFTDDMLSGTDIEER
ncbi:MAG: hypothetical protein E7605_06945 [Ruminococcaceae bacterium]|nr:hypothetical protein [Oscillospiraceae bacterium]